MCVIENQMRANVCVCEGERMLRREEENVSKRDRECVRENAMRQKENMSV